MSGGAEGVMVIKVEDGVVEWGGLDGRGLIRVEVERGGRGG